MRGIRPETDAERLRKEFRRSPGKLGVSPSILTTKALAAQRDSGAHLDSSHAAQTRDSTAQSGVRRGQTDTTRKVAGDASKTKADSARRDGTLPANVFVVLMVAAVLGAIGGLTSTLITGKGVVQLVKRTTQDIDLGAAQKDAASANQNEAAAKADASHAKQNEQTARADATAARQNESQAQLQAQAASQRAKQVADTATAHLQILRSLAERSSSAQDRNPLDVEGKVTPIAVALPADPGPGVPPAWSLWIDQAINAVSAAATPKA